MSVCVCGMKRTLDNGEAQFRLKVLRATLPRIGVLTKAKLLDVVDVDAIQWTCSREVRVLSIELGCTSTFICEARRNND